MVGQPDAILQAQKSIALKLDEPEPDPENPWSDDFLSRQKIATRLTDLVATQKPPLTVSLHGQWGTGKTFMLRRWQRDLENQKPGYRAIYFNAWEDDFCDDPLLAFIGQLSEHFKATGFEALARKVADVAIPLIKENLINVVQSRTGLTFKVKQFKNRKTALIDNYNNERASKDALKKALTDLSAKVATYTGHPLVFIVDELDRCRPTFAIELLEKVKHIFDVPNIVFVFGLNRDELCKSLRSVYGEIDADVYLRRFFDFEFNLGEVDSEEFARILIDKFELRKIAGELSGLGYDSFERDLRNFSAVCPRLWSALNLTLRDIDYGIRLLAFLMKTSSTGSYVFYELLALLIALKFNNPRLYYSLLSGDFQTKEIVEYLLSESGSKLTARDFVSHLDQIEGLLYCVDRVDRSNWSPTPSGSIALFELQQVPEQGVGYTYEIISQRAQDASVEIIRRIINSIEFGQRVGVNARVFGVLAGLIDTYQMDLRR